MKKKKKKKLDLLVEVWDELDLGLFCMVSLNLVGFHGAWNLWYLGFRIL